MITKIIATADLHIRNIKRLDETKEQFQKFLDEARRIVEENGVDQTRIVIAGDLVHSKLTIASECNLMLAWFLNELDGICKTIVIAGNHDLNMSNLDRVDSLTPVFEMCDFKQVHYLDRELDYKSGYVIDDNVVWCLYSTFDYFTGPQDLDILREHEGEGRTFVGLFHGDLNGAKNSTGYCLNGLEPTHFNGTDFVIAGHIHKFQELSKGGARIVYCGSLIQQDKAENVTGHGFMLWDVEKKEWEQIDVANPNYGYYNFKINSETDIDENKEELTNA